MDNDIRKGIYFDLDTKALERYYPKAAWRSAYDDVRMFMEQNGFLHEQGSGYHSELPMTESDALLVISELKDRFAWINKCVGVCTIADVPETYDISHMFDKTADVRERV
jgi:virulence-associated protein VapD